MDIVKEEKEIEEEIYQKVKKEKQIKNRKQLLKDFGDTPLSFFIFLSSLSLTVNTIYWFKLFGDMNFELSLKSYNFEPYYTIFIIIISCCFFLIYLMFQLLALTLYKKSVLLIGDKEQK